MNFEEILAQWDNINSGQSASEALKNARMQMSKKSSKKNSIENFEKKISEKKSEKNFSKKKSAQKNSLLKNASEEKLENANFEKIFSEWEKSHEIFDKDFQEEKSFSKKQEEKSSFENYSLKIFFQKKSDAKNFKNENSPQNNSIKKNSESKNSKIKTQKKLQNGSFGKIFSEWEKSHETFDKDFQNEKFLDENKIQKNAFLKKLSPQATIDLHGMTQDEAWAALDDFVARSQQRGLRKILVIHGKGIHSQTGESVLAGLVRRFAEYDKRLGAFGHADRTQGGSGATWILVRRVK